MSFQSFGISGQQPITVILSVSVSSAVLTQLPEGGMGGWGWFNHLLILSVMVAHTLPGDRWVDAVM